MSDDGAGRRKGDRYELMREEIECYKTMGYVHLKGVLSEDELHNLEEEYMSFLRHEVAVEGRDFCDMSADYSKPLEDYSIVNIMLPSKYNPWLKGNIYEKRAASISEQLLGPDMVFDYDQLLAKPPGKSDGVFHWHQDLAYWPVTDDTRTASFWLAIDNSRVENGCIQFVPGTHLEKNLRYHGPLHGDRDKSHTLAARLAEDDMPKPAEIDRGDVTVHHERTLHGSGINSSTDSWRRAWVVAFRSKETVEFERSIGFTHSHNDKLETLNASKQFLSPFNVVAWQGNYALYKDDLRKFCPFDTVLFYHADP
ncbi:hypothetical protein Mp_2g00030 [Marchantia polymorpha subsp. ruderalis]|uniref:Uncharacterized protein n=1 Tax=Marchantia polymorpha TaxID=3197 RepID=A0A2R6VYS7_MARPO|nr:hypothetical protein MARPO_0432s0001 [Marchantia polymorpha]BBN00533.1 hypothetical protein Mp_2g00030 [Marchantia polymorpha subsp. ruderalis]|eukprot:PTQ26765.1 hypothetical protein MARPO_0432s0001 [Marchantia polymorpha]